MNVNLSRFNSSEMLKISILFFVSIPLVMLMSACTEKSAEEKNLHNTLLNEYPDTFLRAEFTGNGELHLEFELEDESSSTDTLKKIANEYAAYGYNSFGNAEQVKKVTVSLQGAGTGNMSTAAASESFSFASDELKDSD